MIWWFISWCNIKDTHYSIEINRDRYYIYESTLNISVTLIWTSDLNVMDGDNMCFRSYFKAHVVPHDVFLQIVYINSRNY